MVDNLNNLMQHEWNLTNTDAHFNNNNNNNNSNRLSQKQSLSRKISDHTANNNGHNHGQHHHTSQQSIHSPPIITTTDYSNRSALGISPMSQIMLSGRRSLEAGYDTDGAIGTVSSISHPKHSHGYEHFVSPRLPVKRSTNKSSMELPPVPSRQSSPHRTHLDTHPSFGNDQLRNERNAAEIYEADARRHIRLSRRIPARSPTAHNHGTHIAHSSTIPRQERILSSSSANRSFKLIFMRHSERANQALGSDWFSKAFRTNTYKSFDQNLPPVLPKRHSNHAYEFDPPLTVRGLHNAHSTGRAMIDNNLVADVCLCSSAFRCIQTAEQVLKGMEIVDQVPIRVEPGLFECPHLNHKIIESFMTKTELVENKFNIYLDYKKLIPKLNVPESLDEYFDRCALVMRDIINIYGRHGGTILIVTHAPGLLALTSAINGRKPNPQTFYRTVAAYPPLAFFVAEYNGTLWEHSEYPYCLTPTTQ